MGELGNKKREGKRREGGKNMKDTRDGGKGQGGEMIVHEIVCKTEQWEEELNVKNISGNKEKQDNG